MILLSYQSFTHTKISAVDISVTTAIARSFSSGFLPASIPLSFVWNILFFWVPFSGNGFNTRRLNLIREKMSLPVEVTSETACCGA